MNMKKTIPMIGLALLFLANAGFAQSFTFECEEPIQHATQGVNLSIIGYLHNYSAPEDFTVEIDPSEIGSWDFTWCFGLNCFPSFYILHEATLSVGADDSIDVTFIEPDSTIQMTGTIAVTVYPTSMPEDAIRIDFTAYFGDSGVRPVDPGITPIEFSLSPAFPNPFNPTTNFSYSMVKAGVVSIEVYNMLGQKVRTLFNGVQTPGTYAVSWDGMNDFGLDLPAAPYVITLNGAEIAETVKVLKVK